MPRDSNGNYTLPVGNPVIAGTLIESDWANSTMTDIAGTLGDSLSRSGAGAMLAPFKSFSGDVNQPGMGWHFEPDSGWYRAGDGDFRFAIHGQDAFVLTEGGIQAGGYPRPVTASGAVGDNLFDNSAALLDADTKGDGYFPAGTYLVKQSISLAKKYTFADGAKLIADDGVTITFTGDFNAPPTQKIFGWNGTGRFSFTKTRFAYVDWFSPPRLSGQDDVPAMAKALDSIVSGTVWLWHGSYWAYSKLENTKNAIKFFGQGLGLTTINNRNLDGDMSYFHPPVAVPPANQAKIVDNHVGHFTVALDSTLVYTGGASFHIEYGDRCSTQHLEIINPFIGVICTSCQNSRFDWIESVSGVQTQAFIGEAHFIFDENPTLAKRENANVFLTGVRGRSFSIYGTTPPDPNGNTYKMKYGVIARSSDGIYGDGCYFGNNGIADVLLRPQQSDSKLNGFKLSNSWLDPVADQDSINPGSGILSGNVVIDASEMDPAEITWIYAITFEQTIMNASTHNLVIKVPLGIDIYDITISGSQMTRAMKQSVFVHPDGGTVTSLKLTNNTIRDYCRDNVTEAGIELHNTHGFIINDNIIGFNVISDVPTSADYGIHIHETCSDYTISDNNLTGNVIQGILDEGQYPKEVTNNSGAQQFNMGGVNISGDGYLDEISTLTMVPSKKFIWAAQIYINTGVDPDGEYLMHFSGTTFGVLRNSVGKLLVQATDGVDLILSASTANAVIANPGKYEIIVVVDLDDVTKMFVIVNGLSWSLTVVTYTIGAVIDFSVSEFSIGASTTGTFPLVDTDINMMYLYPGQWFDPTKPENRYRFFTNDGKMNNLGRNGEKVVGTIPPIFFAYDDADSWAYNRGSLGGKMTIHAPITESAHPAMGYDLDGLVREIIVSDNTHAVGPLDVSLIINFAGTVTLILNVAAEMEDRELLVRTVQNQAVQSSAANVIPLTSLVAGNSILPAVAGKWARLRKVAGATVWQTSEGN